MLYQAPSFYWEISSKGVGLGGAGGSVGKVQLGWASGTTIRLKGEERRDVAGSSSVVSVGVS